MHMGREWEACVLAKVGGETERNAINIHRIIKLDPHFMPYTKINSRGILDVNARAKTIMPVEK